jgi:hypothetical protein
MRKAGVAHSKSSKDMESHVFLKAKTRVRNCWVEPPLPQERSLGKRECCREWGGSCSLLDYEHSWLCLLHSGSSSVSVEWGAHWMDT